jgi:DNA-binding LacI/PurR family transcriptional regulator/DNA-binding transcriptional regulator YhcF (GntR family)
LKNKGPAIDRALNAIRETIREQGLISGDRLPPIWQLAARLRISSTSLWKALAVAKETGLVSVVRGGRITAGSLGIALAGGGLNPDIINTGSVWRRKRAELEQDIVNGDFQESGVLPSAKELQARYAVCAVTLRKMLAALVRAGMLAQNGKLYRVPLAPKKSRHRSVTVFSAGNDKGIDLQSHRVQKMVEALEYQCGRSDIGLEHVGLDPSDTAMAGRVPDLAAKSKSSIGYMVNLPWAVDRESEERIRDLAAHLAGHGKPMAVLDNAGTFNLPIGKKVRGTMQVFRIAGRLAGRQVGRFLRGLGHRRIAYLSHVHQNEWSRNRLAGLADVFAESGLAYEVAPIVLDNVETYYARSSWLGSLPPAEVAKIASIQSVPEQLEFIIRYLEKGRWPSHWNKSRIDFMQRELTLLHELAKKGHDPRLFVDVRDALLNNVAHQKNEVLFVALFERALAVRGCTAWVTANDGLAGNAMSFLRAKKVNVPKNISVVGFDNMPDRSDRGLTTYDFCISNIVHRMLWSILHHDARHGGTQRGPTEVEGIIIERETAGRTRS